LRPPQTCRAACHSSASPPLPPQVLSTLTYAHASIPGDGEHAKNALAALQKLSTNTPDDACRITFLALCTFLQLTRRGRVVPCWQLRPAGACLNQCRRCAALIFCP
jgi:hypothetical protein